MKDWLGGKLGTKVGFRIQQGFGLTVIALWLWVI